MKMINRSGAGLSDSYDCEECYFDANKSSRFCKSLDEHYKITGKSSNNFTLVFYEVFQPFIRLILK